MGTREIILLRHANANNAVSGESDEGRELSSHGHDEASSAAAWLRSCGAPIHRLLCSPSVRTRQTAQPILGVIGKGEVRYEQRIYNATPGELMDVLAENVDVERLLLIGHNPGLETLAALLATGQSGDYRGMPPAGIAWLSLPADSPIEPGAAKLVHFWSP
jgi:phosphohistidine phosphatase